MEKDIFLGSDRRRFGKCNPGINGTMVPLMRSGWAPDSLDMQPVPELMMESALLGIVLIRNENPTHRNRPVKDLYHPATVSVLHPASYILLPHLANNNTL